MAALLSKFRIDYSDLTIIPDITKRAEEETRTLFNSIIKDFKGDPGDSGKLCFQFPFQPIVELLKDVGQEE